MNQKNIYKIDKDISIARTLDSSFYIDTNIFKTLITDIFSSTWQYGLHLNQIRNMGMKHQHAFKDDEVTYVSTGDGSTSEGELPISKSYLPCFG